MPWQLPENVIIYWLNSYLQMYTSFDDPTLQHCHFEIANRKNSTYCMVAKSDCCCNISSSRPVIYVFLIHFEIILTYIFLLVLYRNRHSFLCYFPVPSSSTSKVESALLPLSFLPVFPGNLFSTSYFGI